MSWRPEERWDNPHKEFEWGDGAIYQYTEPALHQAYEAGADAMLEALKQNGQYCGVGTGGATKNGWLVFIPDEEGR